MESLRAKITFLWLFLSSCATEVFQLYEIIQTPVDLDITPYAGGYIVSFLSDNREEGFSGYGIFKATSEDELKADQVLAEPTYFCPMKGGQIPYTERIQIFIGPNTVGNFLCVFSNLLLSPGEWIAIRARVERPIMPWSKPVIKQVPPP